MTRLYNMYKEHSKEYVASLIGLYIKTMVQFHVLEMIIT